MNGFRHDYHGNVDYEAKTERLDASRPQDIERAAQIIRQGGIVAFPTETVYGLGANALSPSAVEKIFAAKQRPHWDPLIVHGCDLDMLSQLTTLAPILPLNQSRHEPGPHPNNILRTSRILIETFWPGPLTLLLPRSVLIPDVVTAGRPLVALRMPGHPLARRLIERAGVPIAAPSANLFGHTSPTSASHVLQDLDGRIDAVLDGGPTDIGLESTVAEVTLDGVIVYRAGAADLELLSQTRDIGNVRLYQASPPAAKSSAGPSIPRKPESLPSPGVGLRHYAPSAKLVLVQRSSPEQPMPKTSPAELTLVATIAESSRAGEKVGVMLPTGWSPADAAQVYPWADWNDGETLARRLFAGLRELDNAGATAIVCPVPEMPGIGDAIRDRLQKAARRS